jgi:hypothetical protein
MTMLKMLVGLTLLAAASFAHAQVIISYVPQGTTFSCGRTINCINVPNDQGKDLDLVYGSTSTITIDGKAFTGQLYLTDKGPAFGYANEIFTLTGSVLAADGGVATVSYNFVHYHGACSGRGGSYCWKWYVEVPSTVTVY